MSAIENKDLNGRNSETLVPIVLGHGRSRIAVISSCVLGGRIWVYFINLSFETRASGGIRRCIVLTNGALAIETKIMGIAPTAMAGRVNS